MSHNPAPGEILYDTPTAAARLGISRRTLSDLASAGEIGHYAGIGKGFKFSEAHLAEYLAAREVTPARKQVA